MTRLAALAATIALSALVASPSIAPLGAQRLGPEPPRPKGIQPAIAAAAFYWAARINPGSADALYARRAALLMSNESLRTMFVNGGRRARDSKQLRALDSLYLRALNLNPLLYRKLDRRLLTAHIVEGTQREMRRSGSDVTRSGAHCGGARYRAFGREAERRGVGAGAGQIGWWAEAALVRGDGG